MPNHNAAKLQNPKEFTRTHFDLMAKIPILSIEVDSTIPRHDLPSTPRPPKVYNETLLTILSTKLFHIWLTAQ